MLNNNAIGSNFSDFMKSIGGYDKCNRLAKKYVSNYKKRRFYLACHAPSIITNMPEEYFLYIKSRLEKSGKIIKECDNMSWHNLIRMQAIADWPWFYADRVLSAEYDLGDDI